MLYHLTYYNFLLNMNFIRRAKATAYPVVNELYVSIVPLFLNVLLVPIFPIRVP